MSNDPRTWLDAVYLLTVSAAFAVLAYQGWRRVPEARPLAFAFAILLLQGALRLALSGPGGGQGRGAPVPVLDRTLGTLFLLLVVYGLVRPLFPAYRASLNAMLASYLGFLVGLSALVLVDFPQHAGPGVRFADHWGSIAYEFYQIPLILAAMGVMLAVRRVRPAIYTTLALLALGLWLVGHVVHLGGLLVGQDTPTTWGILLRLAEIAGLVLVTVVIVRPDPDRQSIATRYLADAESVVSRLQAQVQQLAAAKAALEERERLARELHDSVSQSLFSIELNAGAAEALLDRDAAKARQRIARLRAAAHEALGDLRALIAELRPPALEGKRLDEALRDYAQALEDGEGLDIVVETHMTGELDREAETELFRIGYEALTNVVKHAEASQAWVELAVTPPSFRLRIADDGVGMPNTPANGARPTFGLSGMRERAALLGARLSIGSRAGGGAEVIVER